MTTLDGTSECFPKPLRTGTYGELYPSGGPSHKCLTCLVILLSSLVAAVAGAQVTHVDASRKSVTWARDNQHYRDER